MKRFTMNRIAQGERLPWWLGVAYPDYKTQSYVVTLFGFHWIVGLAFRVYWLLKGFGIPKNELARLYSENTRYRKDNVRLREAERYWRQAEERAVNIIIREREKHGRAVAACERMAPAAASWTNLCSKLGVDPATGEEVRA